MANKVRYQSKKYGSKVKNAGADKKHYLTMDLCFHQIVALQKYSC